MGDSGPKSAAKSVVEDIKGKVKEAAGAMTNNDDLREEGRAQQDKAAAERDVAEHEAKATKEEVKADAARAEERAHEARQAAKQ